jgi:hypothetical protein
MLFGFTKSSGSSIVRPGLRGDFGFLVEMISNGFSSFAAFSN